MFMFFLHNSSSPSHSMCVMWLCMMFKCVCAFVVVVVAILFTLEFNLSSYRNFFNSFTVRVNEPITSKNIAVSLNCYFNFFFLFFQNKSISLIVFMPNLFSTKISWAFFLRVLLLFKWILINSSLFWLKMLLNSYKVSENICVICFSIDDWY